MYIVSIILTAVVFLALILNLAVKPSFYKKLTNTIMFVSILCGVIFYGYGYAYTGEPPVLMVFKAAYSVCGMFLGKSDLSAIASAPGMSNNVVLTVFWLSHIGAFYTTASAVITAVGYSVLTKLRMIIARHKDLVIIYGTGDTAISLAQSITSQECSIVFVDEKVSVGAENALRNIGALLRTDKDAIHPNKKFIKSLAITPGNRKIEIYAMKSDIQSNYSYALELLEAFKQAKIKPDQTSISFPGNTWEIAQGMQYNNQNYGYGYVNMYDESSLVARMMVKLCPPWDTISFGTDAKAKEDFETLIIGFGRLGQAALKSLIMNGQYEGSQFRAFVFDPYYDSASGYLTHEAPELLTKFDISFIAEDARSKALFDFLNEHKEKLKYIAVCIGDEKTNYEVYMNLMNYYSRNNGNCCVVRCTHRAVITHQKLDSKANVLKIYTRDTLSGKELDKRAMIVNHYYCGNNGKSMVANWLECDYFSRMSSRATADFSPAFIRASGCAVEAELNTTFSELNDEQLENMGRTEHLRWEAFHTVMGFSTMSEEEWLERAELYKKEITENGLSKVKISKDINNRTHACLIPWEMLENLEMKEMEITGINPAYREKDINNVLAVPNILKQEFMSAI